MSLSGNVIEEKVRCFDIKVFDLNQRVSENPKFDDIKSSIKEIGINDPLQIMKRPYDNSWVLSHGGQTRLKACKELYNETGEDRFLYPPIIIREYTSDLSICINHLVENNLRSGNTFYETCNALLNIRNLISKHYNSNITQDLLAEEMGDRGIPVRRQSITAMIYLSENLAPNITNNIFLNRVSRKTIDGIRSLRKQVNKYGSSESFDHQLIEFINSFDGDVSLNKIKEFFCIKNDGERLSNESDSYTSVKMMVDKVGLLCDIIKSDILPFGFIVRLPKDKDSSFNAKMTFVLIQLSGVFSGYDNCPEVLLKMGIYEEIKCPDDLFGYIKSKLNINNLDERNLILDILKQGDRVEIELLNKIMCGINISN